MSEVTPGPDAAIPEPNSSQKPSLAPQAWWLTLWKIASSLKTAVVLLLILFLLTILGTFHQVEHGLLAAQELYFDSWYVIQPLPGPFAFPLPGGYLAMLLLTINLICGGIVRLKWQWRRAGILVIHFGIVIMMVAGAVKFHMAQEGYLLLQEGAQSAYYNDHYLWEVAISAERDDGTIREYRIPSDSFSHLDAEEWRSFNHPELPFTLELGGFQANCRAVPKGPMVDAQTPVVDGWFLLPQEREAEAERNVIGLQARVAGTEGEQRGLLYGDAQLPWTVASDGKQFGVTLRHYQYPMPFSVRLDDFMAEFHPGTGMARSFRSKITVLDEDEQGHLIQMNEPLRRDGVVMFQASYGPPGAGPNDPMYSVFQVVENPSDQWPLWSCIIIAIGLVWHFGSMLLRYMSRSAAARRAALQAVGIVGLLLIGLTQAPAAETEGPVYEPWPASAVSIFRTIPVQEAGRIKPLSTAASFTLLRLNGRRSVRYAGVTIEPTAWALDLILRPEIAEQQNVFQLQTSEVLDAIGMDHDEKKKRDRYSYQDLLPGRQALMALADGISAKDRKQRDYRENQILGLAENIRSFERWRDGMEVVRWRIDPTGSPVLEKFIGTDSATALEVYEHRAPLLYALDNITEISDEELRASERRRLEQVLGRAVTILKVESEPAFLPPMHPTDETWLTTSAMLSGMIHGDGHGHDWSRHLGILGAWQAVFDAGTDEAALLSAAQAVHDQSAGLAAERGEYRKIASEDSYYRQDLLYKALLLFVLAFVLTAMLWLRPSSKILAGSVWTSSALAVVLVIAAITWRCILRERPPVSTLYETVLFITGSIGLLGLIIEAIVRNRVALSLVSLLGAMGLFLAMRYETTEAVDTMPQLIAVLDTNFWLATHVTTVTLGYAAGLLAGAIAIVYLGGRLIGFRRDDKQLYRSIAQLVYGVTCFGLVFAVVGTILGGIWANESWGRFWGWDPKENGALLIVLAQLAILHARMAGWIRAYGLCLAAVLTIGVVVFSWWHVNQLGAGLHSYGHTDGVMQAILIAYSVVLVMFGLGLLARFRDLKRARVSAELGELD